MHSDVISKTVTDCEGFEESVGCESPSHLWCMASNYKTHIRLVMQWGRSTIIWSAGSTNYLVVKPGLCPMQFWQKIVIFNNTKMLRIIWCNKCGVIWVSHIHGTWLMITRTGVGSCYFHPSEVIRLTTMNHRMVSNNTGRKRFDKWLVAVLSVTVAV